jgi:predicted nucleic acid-binding protein
MIVVDSSVWIANIRDEPRDSVARLREISNLDTILVGDLVLLEVLRGARDDLHARQLEVFLRRFSVVPLLDPKLAVRAAGHSRTLRARGITIRKTIDVIIATFCIEHGHHLLHDDRDFEHFRPLGLLEV